MRWPGGPAVHWPSVRGRARADAGPLLLIAVVVAVVSMLAGAAQPLMRATADDAVRDAVRAAGPDADVLASSRWPYDDVPGGRGRVPGLAAEVDHFRKGAGYALDSGLAEVLRPGAATVVGPTLDVTDGSLLRTFRLAYLADERGPQTARVTWIAGGPPRASADAEAIRPYHGPPWPVQVGLSEADAAALRVRPGDRIPLKDKSRQPKDVRVSGIFRATDPDDPTWQLAPWLLRPLSGADGVGNTRLGGLLSPDSLPDARLAVEQDEFDRTVHFTPDPAALDADAARDIAATLVTLKARSGTDGTLEWRSELDGVLRKVQMRVNATSAQVSVLLAGVLAGTVLVLTLAAGLLARRRAAALTTARERGAGLAGLSVELLLESAALAVAASAVGLAAARAVAPGVAWEWAVPVAIAAAVTGPAAGVLLAARATRDRRVPANRTARRHLLRTAALRRLAVEGAVVAAAAAAVVALHQRGILPASASASGGTFDAWSGVDDTAALTAAAPALGVVAGALVLLRLLPVAVRRVLRRALRSGGPVAVFGAARAAATAGRALPLLAMVASTALATYALALGTTAERGLVDAAWGTVGADVRVDVGPGADVDVPALARRIAGAPGVRHTVTAEVVERARVTSGTTAVTPRMVIVDAPAYRRLLAGTPLPDVPALDGLAAGGKPVPALVRSADGSLSPGVPLQLPRTEEDAVPLTATGVAPDIGDTGDVVVVDAGALAAAGVAVVPNTIWVSGPGAEQAVAGVRGADVVVRTDVLRDRRAEPLTAGLLALARVSAGVLVALGLLALALGAAASAPQRGQTLGRLRTLGLRMRDGRRVAAGELLPAAVTAAVGGPVLGVLLAYVTLEPLALRLVAGWSREPAPAVPWWGAGIVGVVLVAAVGAVVAVEAAVRKRHPLGELLRVGG